MTSLYEIDHILQECKEVNAIDETKDQEEAIRKVLLEEYQSYIDVFSKEESDKQPPHQSYDHQIELTKEEHNLGYSPLYKMTTKELEIVKKYLIDNLAKGFIKPSQAPFTTLVLFAKKPSGGLQFYIDFQETKLDYLKRSIPIATH